MYIKHGTARFVLCFPTHGLVVKFAKPKPITFLRCVKSAIQIAWWSKESKWLRKPFNLSDEDLTMNIGYTLLNGIYANWIENSLWKQTKSDFLQPTHFSLFGLVNIQEYGSELPMKDENLWCHLVELTEEAVWSNGHHFSNAENFCQSNGKVRMIDYGAKGVAEVIISHGVRLAASFDVDYVPN